MNQQLIHAKTYLARIFQNRLILLGILFFIQMQFFVINLLNSHLREPNEGWELKIPMVDNNLTPNGVWLIPYTIGFFFAILVPLWAMFFMPSKLYRQFVIALVVAALFSYAIYILLPTYVVKPAPETVPGNHVLAQMLRHTYELDAEASTHNAAPSQHVFYAIINACFMIHFRPRKRVFIFWTLLATSISASALLTMRHNSPDLIAGYLVAVGAYYTGLYLGAKVTSWLDDEEDSVILPVLAWRISSRKAKYPRSHPRSRDLRAEQL
ncbi:MAG: phosphatase PAP2 family protein, partial [Anaerolineae bacterium]|nr:phosphatase PAP2 family protein [Anaerolineae bacterium]